ncbi:uncharacterized protein VICG_00550 [Vittaforma corneae ATCC 50505]|uniref:Uncharacterized protein n=1 Tax=Vittaforma corneae (strain ATCC 50505) TaxID=993615 RepID=L2GNN2_VITCO|nr:uncharacterized protein VICG_00550 [Vittaforma corneae ATCC 50505]ELA42451.1 hypothetical protein VICG_00550 [Vittaforma corneae ATCC 50505]
MNNPAQPKKRGRKKKIEIVPEKIHVPKAEQPQIIQAKNIVKSPENLQLEREKIVKELEEKASKVDKLVDDEKIINRVHQRMISKQRFSNRKNEWELERNVGKTVDDVEWQTVILPGMMNRMCLILEFLLKNGPMTRIDNDIFNECVEVIRLYYTEQLRLISKSDINSNLKEICITNMLCPDDDMPANKVINEILSEFNFGEDVIKKRDTEK